MELKKKTEDIEVNGKKYRLQKMDARTGSYLAAKLAVFAVPLMNKEQKVNAEDFGKLLSAMDFKEFSELQNTVLRTVLKIVETPTGDELPEMLLDKFNEITDEELAYDTASLIQLTVRALIFNIGGFFGERGLGVMRDQQVEE